MSKRIKNGSITTDTNPTPMTDLGIDLSPNMSVIDRSPNIDGGIISVSEKDTASNHRESVAENVQKSKERTRLTRKQILTILSLAYGNFCLGTIYALLAPFFPHEAEKKGVSPTQYGAIFGVFEIGQFIFAPIIGLIIPLLSPKFFMVIGLFITAYCNILFALLQWSPHGMTFFSIAFILRLSSAVGACSFLTACLTTIAIDFHDRVSTLYATTEMCFGVGMIVGPSIGGFLFEVGGFSLPFCVAGIFCLLGSAATYLLLPTQKENQSKIPESERVSVFELFGNFGVFVNILITFTTFMNVGFNDATLEHHIRDFTSVSPSTVGLIFLVSGLIYSICSQVWGLIIYKYSNAHPFCFLGYVFSLAFFLLSGPMYPLPIEPNITLIIVSQALYGISMGGQLVGSFTQGLRHTIKSGFPDNISTSSAMSSLYQSSCALGAAVGPIIGGYLMDHHGYRKASIFMVTLQVFMMLVIIGYAVYERVSLKTAIKGRENIPE